MSCNLNASTCYLYVLPLAYEDILKVGISRDPLARAQAFSRRFYECFDLSRSLLVEFEARREAQARETALHRRLRDWNAVQPITVPDAAAGKTEWYRGAYALLEAAVAEDAASGHVVHAPALEWCRMRLREERANLYEWASAVLRMDDGPPVGDARARLMDTLDAYRALAISLDGALPPEWASEGGSHPELRQAPGS